jgi:hypothetical protein
LLAGWLGGDDEKPEACVGRRRRGRGGGGCGWRWRERRMGEDGGSSGSAAEELLFNGGRLTEASAEETDVWDRGVVDFEGAGCPDPDLFLFPEWDYRRIATFQISLLKIA